MLKKKEFFSPLDTISTRNPYNMEVPSIFHMPKMRAIFAFTHVKAQISSKISNDACVHAPGRYIKAKSLT
ncbi:hypothetical protein, partial [Nemorincola caseinilytica]|uniref:hypothetical protein n=1 Tax=Nemorincola caseinilytica TaxID=2054315 RepID=UPI0031EB43C9